MSAHCVFFPPRFPYPFLDPIYLRLSRTENNLNYLYSGKVKKAYNSLLEIKISI